MHTTGIKMAHSWYTFQYWKDRATFVLVWLPAFILTWIAFNIVPGVLTYYIKSRAWLIKPSGGTIEEYARAIRRFGHIKKCLRAWYNEYCLKETQLGQKAPDATLFDLKGQSKISLLGLQKKGRPLVMNFGSCT